MARSKKDGKHRGGHKLRKWRRLEFRRRASQSRAMQQELQDTAEELAAIDWELYEDYLHHFAEEVDWYDEWAAWESDLRVPYPDDFDYDELEPRDWFEPSFGDEYDRAYDPEYHEPDFEVFQAVDRAISLHGMQAVEKQAALIGALFNVPSWEITRCINLTSHGYIRRSS